MTCLQFADGGNGFQVWRVEVNTFNKQPWTANKGCSSSLGLCMGLTITIKNKHVTNHKKNETPLFATVFVVLSTLHYYMFQPT
jgi:hypothetical protein